MEITVLGLGYIGLPTAITFAKYDQTVCGVDIEKSVVEELNSGRIHIEEPGLQNELVEVLKSGRFEASLTIRKADVFIVTVPTPNKNTDKSCDLTYVERAVTSILPYLEKGNTVVIESTIAPRTTEDFIKPMIEAADFVIGEDIYLVHCPERVLPGQIMKELVSNDRVIGGITEACTRKGKEIYRLFVEGELLGTNASSAEMSKLMENTFRDVNIALANELVKISYELMLDAVEIIELANKHPRVNIHQPGPGVGGHCLAVDPYFITAASPDNSPLIQTAREINSSMPPLIAEKTVALMEKYNGKKIAILGLSYKGDTDDLRKSPAVEIYDSLKKNSKGYEVCAYDPYVKNSFIEKNRAIALAGADVALILTDHTEFRTLTIEDFSQMNQKILFDTKNIASDCGKEMMYYHMGELPA